MHVRLLLIPVLGAALLGLAFVPAAPLPSPGPVPKTVILGFDGMDFALTQRWINEGKLPNFKRLADMGLFQPLQTSNPAQSPVSWAVFNTGCNPGKTGVAGFVSRFFTEAKKRPGKPDIPSQPMPQQMLGFTDPAQGGTKVPADDFVRFPIALHHPGVFVAGAAGVGLLGGLLLGLLLRLALRAHIAVVPLLALAAAAATGFCAHRWASELPADGMLPYVVNPMQGTNFWSYLDKAGVRMRGVQVASTYPPDDEGPETSLLSGLGVMDVTGSPGSWYVYTTSRWVLLDKKTDTAGKIVLLHEDEPGKAEGKLTGPLNWVEQAAQFDRELAELAAQRSQPGIAEAAGKDLDARISALNKGLRDWKASDASRTSVPFTIAMDKAAHAVDFNVQGHTFRVEQGGWSEMIPIEFVLNPLYKAHGLVTFHVIRCEDDADGTRIFVPPINIDPMDPPPQIPISAGPKFSADLERQIGHPYETLGWACITNPLKDIDDSGITEQAFMDDLESTEKLREDLLVASLDRANEWDVYFQVFSTTDRAGHMLFREFDPQHPAHDPKVAEMPVHAFGKTFPLKEAIPEVYMNEDRILGHVLEKIDSGALGKDCLLMIVSDHGFTSFRRQVNLNNVLNDLGYLVFKAGADGQPMNLEAARDGEILSFVDWSKTRAYSMGLGEVFINLQGREKPEGIVPPDQYDAVVDQICADLLKLKDPKDGASVVTSASRRDKLYTGPWWKEGTALRKVFHKMVEVHHDGFADIFLGYAPTYRVAWSNTMGNLDSAAITDNDNRWSGDHVSVDPSHVPGVLFSNRKFSQPAISGLMDVGPTVLKRYGIDPSPPHTEMDGHVLPFENLAQ